MTDESPRFVFRGEQNKLVRYGEPSGGNLAAVIVLIIAIAFSFWMH